MTGVKSEQFNQEIFMPQENLKDHQVKVGGGDSVASPCDLGHFAYLCGAGTSADKS